MVTLTMIFTSPMIPSYLVIKGLGLDNSMWAIILPGMISGYNFFIMRSFFAGIPGELIDAARIDGLNTFRTYLRIILPLAVPAIVAQAILCFVSGYNNFLGALLYLPGRSDLQPLQLQLYTLVGYWTGFNDSGRMAAATLVSMLPLIIVYIIFRRQFRAGITDGAVKS